ncbi:MAG: rhamnulokinase family protein [Pirellula sp.]
MPIEDVILAIDLGASSGRVIAAELISNRIELHEVHRFENSPVPIGARLHWNLHGLWQNIESGIRKSVDQYPNRILSAGVDTWGVDYVLLDRNLDLVGPAFCYRDARTNGMMLEAFKRLPQSEIFSESGVQFMEINTAYQLLSMKIQGSPLLDIADHFLMIPDFIHWLLTGELSNEYTNASTTQLLHPSSGNWSTRILDSLGLPKHIFKTPIQPGTSLGKMRSSVRNRTGIEQNVQVIAPATHDTGSAVLAVPAKGFASETPKWCYISSGTWSLMGVELAKPILTDKCFQLNFTNEGGANGSVRLLKNIAGLWPFQQCKAAWQRKGESYDWQQLERIALESKPLQNILDLDHKMFLAPDNMLTAVQEYAAKTNQPAFESDGAIARCTMESLALKYRVCLGWLEELLGYRLDTIHIVGGGVQNKLLCQMTANACQRHVVAGPVEATALGNVISQLIALGRFNSITEGRNWMSSMSDIMHYEPEQSDAWEEAANRLQDFAKRSRNWTS